MWIIAKKEFAQFYAAITGFLAVALFLILLGVVLFVFPDSNIFNFGYASLQPFFYYIPWLLLFLIPAVGMRSFADEFKQGTFEVLSTLPLQPWQIVAGKILGCFLIVCTAVLPTIIYVVSVQYLSIAPGVDVAATIGSYIGLLLLCLVFCSISVWVSSLSNNAVIAFLASAFIGFVLFFGFDALSAIPAFKGSYDYAIEYAGINFHYKSISRGVILISDIVYFVAIASLFFLFTLKKISSK